MDKNELVECIRDINKTAEVEFLESFSEQQLQDYLEHLMELDLQQVPVCS